MEKYTKVAKFLIAGGNPTLLFWDVSPRQKKLVTSKYLNSVDQIGFVKNECLDMMGRELCVNALIALASTLKESGFIYTTALDRPIGYFNKDGSTTIKLPMRWKKIEENVILLEGIGFKLENNNYKISKSELKSLSKDFNLPAFGIIVYKKNRITPYIYVKQTNSLKKETACGSGSIALSILKGVKDIKQPAGGMIKAQIKNDYIEITANVNRFKFNEEINF